MLGTSSPTLRQTASSASDVALPPPVSFRPHRRDAFEAAAGAATGDERREQSLDGLPRSS